MYKNESHFKRWGTVATKTKVILMIRMGGPACNEGVMVLFVHPQR